MGYCCGRTWLVTQRGRRIIGCTPLPVLASGQGGGYITPAMPTVLRFIEPCLPSPADRPPSGSNWIHEIKHDGYRLMARRDSVGIRPSDLRSTFRPFRPVHMDD